MNKFILSIICFWAVISTCWAAGNVKVTAKVTPTTVAVGEAFKLEYTVNSMDSKNINAPSFKGFEVLNGPAISTFSSYQIINSKVSSGSSTTFTYILSPLQKGQMVIPGAIVTVEGKNYRSNAVKINVIAGHATATTKNNAATTDEVAVRTRGGVGKKDLFITVTANKTRVYEQEAIVLTYKVYTLVNLTQLSGKMPDLKGFLSQEVALPQQKTFTTERVNGRLYRTTMWSQYVMFPQQTGQLKIPSITFEGAVTMENPNIDPIDAFFNGSDYQVKVTRNTPALDVTVNPLPTPKPANFSGAVGKLSISAAVITPSLKTNEAATLRITITGVGNMKLIKTPTVKFPSSFDTYDAKVTDQTQLTGEGISGKMVYDYTVVPREKGHYEIPPIEFVYFDINANQYKTLRTSPITLDIKQGEKTAKDADAEMILRNSDIRSLHLDKAHNEGTGRLWGTAVYPLLYLVVILLAVACFILSRRYQQRNADVVGRKGRKAGKEVLRRMKIAKDLLGTGNQDRFYDEVAKALWGYVADKFNLSTSSLNKETLETALISANVPIEVVKGYVVTIENCEFARFSPEHDPDKMTELYQDALSAIQNLEQHLNKRKVR